MLKVYYPWLGHVEVVTVEILHKHTHTPPLSACLQLSGPHFEGFDQKLQTVSLALCDHVICAPDNVSL